MYRVLYYSNRFLSITLDLLRKIHYNSSDCAALRSEVIYINEKKFLTELSKLLTFMYEEDRQMALSMYEKMFSFAEDETALLHFLGSPTKQAVLIARSYNAKERKLAVTSQTGKDDADVAGGEVPPFVLAINGIHAEAEDLDLINSEVMQDQISIFSDDFSDDLSAEDEDALFTPEEPDNIVEEPASTEDGSSQRSPSEAENELSSIDLSGFTLEMPDEVASFIAAAENYDRPEDELHASPLHMPEETAPLKTEKSAPTAKNEDTEPGDNLMLDLGPIPDARRNDVNEINVTMAAFQESEAKKEPKKEIQNPIPVQTTLSEFKDLSSEQSLPWKKEPAREVSSSARPIIPLMILYLIFAVPITAACVLILLVPALLFLFLAVAAGIVGFHVIVLAFGHFAVFADIMVVLGTALVLFALALLFLWFFLWFIGGAIAGLINGVIRLGGKICYREEKDA